jgi:hypothetical protein
MKVDDVQCVSGLLVAPPKARACYVLAHGAGAGMEIQKPSLRIFLK